MARPVERWRLDDDGREHVVEIADTGLRHTITWRVDGREIASKKTGEERVVLEGEAGALRVRLAPFTGPARQVTWYPPDGELGATAAAHVGLGGLDLDPEAGSRAAAREAWIRAHPHRHAARRTAAAVLGILLPLLGLWLLARIPWPDLSIPWPDWDLPSIPWPDWDLPSIPWPDVSIPWPDWQLSELPGWVREVLDKAKYVGPVVLAYLLARAEVRRRRGQDERKRRAPDPRPGGDDAVDPEP